MLDQSPPFDRSFRLWGPLAQMMIGHSPRDLLDRDRAITKCTAGHDMLTYEYKHYFTLKHSEWWSVTKF